MGCSNSTIIMNKFLAIACLATVATAAPEADADAFYSTYGYGLGHYGYGLGAYGYAGYPYAGYSGYTGYPYHHAAYNYGAYSPYTYGLGYAAYAAPAVKAVDVKTVAAPAVTTIAHPLAYHAAPLAT